MQIQFLQYLLIFAGVCIKDAPVQSIHHIIHHFLHHITHIFIILDTTVVKVLSPAPAPAVEVLDQVDLCLQTRFLLHHHSCQTPLLLFMWGQTTDPWSKNPFLAILPHYSQLWQIPSLLITNNYCHPPTLPSEDLNLSMTREGNWNNMPTCGNNGDKGGKHFN